MAPPVLELCFWPVKTRKKLELFEMHICHWFGAQRWFMHKIKKPGTASLLLHCIDECCCFGYENEFCYAVFQVLGWSFLVLNFDGNVCHCIPNVIWPWMDWSWSSLFESGFPRWLHIFTDWNRQELLNCYSFWWHRVFSMFTLRGILVCSLKLLVPFNQRVF